MTRGVRALRLSRLCPASTVVGFDRVKYAKLCLHVAKRAEHAFAHKSAVELPGPVSRARQCAHLDAFRDLVAGVLHEASRQGHLRRRTRDNRPITASTITMITTMVQSMTRPFIGEPVQLSGGPRPPALNAGALAVMVNGRVATDPGTESSVGWVGHRAPMSPLTQSSVARALTLSVPSDSPERGHPRALRLSGSRPLICRVRHGTR